MKRRQICGCRATLLPHNLQSVGGRQLIQWADTANLDLRFGFFRDSIDALSGKSRVAEISSPLSIKQNGINNDLAAYCKGMIFHSARCGSTLLCQMLKQHPDVLVLGEPAIIGQLFRANNLTAKEKYETLCGVIASYLEWSRNQHRCVVFKFSSWQLRHWQLLRDILPTTPAIVLHREPLPVLDSLSRRPPGWLRKRVRAVDASTDSSSDTFLPQACHAYSEFLKHAESLLATSPTICLAYKSLGSDLVVSDLLKDLKLDQNQTLIRRTLDQRRHSAKQRADPGSGSSEQPYQPRPASDLLQTKLKLGDRLLQLQQDYDSFSHNFFNQGVPAGSCFQ